MKFCSGFVPKNEKTFLKNEKKNQLLQNGTDMNFDVGMSACGAIGDTQARKPDIKRVYTNVKTIFNANLL
jgi:hypothetical protein